MFIRTFLDTILLLVSSWWPSTGVLGCTNLVPVLETKEGFEKLEHIEIQVQRVMHGFKLLSTISQSNNICLGDSGGFATF